METTETAVKHPPELITEIRGQLELEFQKKMEEETARLGKANEEALKKALEDYEKKMAPPDPQELQKVLEQEYITFRVRLVDEEKEREFTIQELPQTIEKKFYKKAKDRLVPLASELESLTINLLDGDVARKITAAINAFEPFLDLTAELAALALDPYGKNGIDQQWVQDRLSSTRIIGIMNAQLECNRMRDFLSLVSRASSLVT